MKAVNSTLKLHIYLILVASLISWSAFAVVALKMQPPLDEASWLGIVFLYISLFVSLTTTLSLLVLLIRKFVSKESIGDFNVAIRQGGLLAVLATAALALQSLHILNWLSGILLISVIVLIEFYFSSTST